MFQQAETDYAIKVIRKLYHMKLLIHSLPHSDASVCFAIVLVHFIFILTLKVCNMSPKAPPALYCYRLSLPGPIGEGNNPLPGLTTERTPRRGGGFDFSS